MSCCPPSCAVPSCTSRPCCSPCYPTGGLGSLNCCAPRSCGGCSATASSLGISPCVHNVGCINQIPPSEVVIQPPACCVTIPGPIIAASCEPVRVGGYTACGGSCSQPCGRICGSPC